MKRLIPAAIIFVVVILLCISAHIFTSKIYRDTINDIDQYNNQTISTETLRKKWKTNKTKLSFFVNHSFLDKITIHIDQLTLPQNSKGEKNSEIYQTIETILSMIKEEQRLSLHSFY